MKAVHLQQQVWVYIVKRSHPTLFFTRLLLLPSPFPYQTNFIRNQDIRDIQSEQLDNRLPFKRKEHVKRFLKPDNLNKLYNTKRRAKELQEDQQKYGWKTENGIRE